MDTLVADEPELAFRIILFALPLFRTDREIGWLAAGPLENLVDAHGARMIEEIEREAAASARFRYLLSGIWGGPPYNDEAVWRRIQAAVRPGPWLDEDPGRRRAPTARVLLDNDGRFVEQVRRPEAQEKRRFRSLASVRESRVGAIGGLAIAVLHPAARLRDTSDAYSWPAGSRLSRPAAFFPRGFRSGAAPERDRRATIRRSIATASRRSSLDMASRSRSSFRCGRSS